MKKSTLENLRNYLNGDNTVDVATLRAEVTAEYDRVTAKSRANTELYDAAHDVVMACEAWHEPMTVKDLWPLVEADMPEGFTPSKMQYAFREKWPNEVERHDNGKEAFKYSRRT